MKVFRYLLLHILLVCVSIVVRAQESVPRVWVNELLNAIRNDFARPPVHARNLHHLSIGMYDAWAAFEPAQNTLFLDKNFNGFDCPFLGVPLPVNDAERIAAEEMAVSYFAFRLIRHRFANSPGAFQTYQSIETRMQSMGYDIGLVSQDYISDGPAALGNYLAEMLIQFGFQDGSNEIVNYASQFYETANPPIEPEIPGNPNMIDPNRWQAISLTNAIDQAGNPVVGVPPFVAPEWGYVAPFALDPLDAVELLRDDEVYKVYQLPDSPPFLDTTIQTELEDFFKWNFLLVSVWQSHLDPSDNVLWDVSPASRGNILSYPDSWSEYSSFYDFFNGGDNGQGYVTNPITGLPYEEQLVKRADYARVLAEFWADGLDSETPPGHWFEIYNEVSEHPLFEWKWKGQGETLSHLEYDVKAYLSLGGAMHDAAIAAWSIKGWFDYPRPVSSIRYMADLGQSSNPLEPNYHPGGLPIVPGYVELVNPGDPLEGVFGEHVGKIKLYTWKGHEFVFDPETDVAGVGWILAENWWPYQRPTFVTPPFAGYVSGHSTFSRAAAEVMSFITGSPFFPGGMSSFSANQNDFLHFELGPSETIVLQWATYRDAADQCSLSRIWGGIHPPIDDIPGRKIGEQVGVAAALYSDSIINIVSPEITISTDVTLINDMSLGTQLNITFNFSSIMDNSIIPNMFFPNDNSNGDALVLVDALWISSTEFYATFDVLGDEMQLNDLVIGINNLYAIGGFNLISKLFELPVTYDTQNPVLNLTNSNSTLLTAQMIGGQIQIDWVFSEACSESIPSFTINSNLAGNTELLSIDSGVWITPNIYRWFLSVLNVTDSYGTVTFEIDNVYDLVGNPLVPSNNFFVLTADMLPLQLISTFQSSSEINLMSTGIGTYWIELSFNRNMNTDLIPSLIFDNDEPLDLIFQPNSQSGWLSDTSCRVIFDVTLNPSIEATQVPIILEFISDMYGNQIENLELPLVVNVDLVKPTVENVTMSLTSLNPSVHAASDFFVDIEFSESMFLDQKPLIEWSSNGFVSEDLIYDFVGSLWLNDSVFRSKFYFNTVSPIQQVLDLNIAYAKDELLNTQLDFTFTECLIYEYSNNVGIGEIAGQQNLTLFPNPVKNGSDIMIKGLTEFDFIKLTDLNGKELMYFEELYESNEVQFLEIHTVSSGMFFLEVHLGDTIRTFKLFVHD